VTRNAGRFLPHVIYSGNMYAMRRTTLFIDDKVLRRAQRAARARGVSFATVVREALALYLSRPDAPGNVPAIAGRFTSGHDDTADRADELLWNDPHG
jgi:hypothetical protein